MTHLSSLQQEAWTILLKRIREELAKPGNTQAGIARTLGVNRSAIFKWLSGDLQGKRVSIDAMRRYFSRLGLDPAPYFGGDISEEAEYRRVPWLEATASMGGGSVQTSKALTAHLAFRTDWLRSKGSLKGMVAINASGDSMSPTIPDRAVVLINEDDKRPVNNGIFFVCYGEEVFLKRLRVDRFGRVTHLISDLDGWEKPLDPVEYFEIIGRALWYGKEL